MLAKLLTLLTATKGAAVATAIVLGAATVTVGVSSPDVQSTVQQVVQRVTGQPDTDTEQAKAKANGDCDRGQPVVVEQRNAADKLLRTAFQEDQKALEDLRGKGADNKAAGDLIKTADDRLKDTLETALNAVGAQTLGRDGQNKPSGSPVAKPSGSPKASGSPVACAAESPKPSDHPTLDAGIKTVVDKAILDMAAIVKDAQAKVGALPTADHGKPSGEPGNGNKPSDKPSDKPGGKPSETPKR